MGCGKAEESYRDEHWVMTKGWRFLSTGKVIEGEERRHPGDYDDAREHGLNGGLFSSKKIAREKRDAWIKSQIPVKQQEVKDMEVRLKQLKRTLWFYRSHTAKVAVAASNRKKK